MREKKEKIGRKRRKEKDGVGTEQKKPCVFIRKTNYCGMEFVFRSCQWFLLTSH